MLETVNVNSHFCFRVQPLGFLQSIKGQVCHGCINYDKVVGLYSELFMRFSYYIHRAYGKKYESHWNRTRDLSVILKCELIRRMHKSINLIIDRFNTTHLIKGYNRRLKIARAHVRFSPEMKTFTKS